MSFHVGDRVIVIARSSSGIHHLQGEYGTIRSTDDDKWLRMELDDKSKDTALGGNIGIPVMKNEIRKTNGIEYIKRRHNL